MTRVASLLVLVLCASNLRAERPELVVQTGHSGAINSIAFSADSRLLASASADRTIGLWDTETGDQLRSLKGHTDEVSSVVFDPTGKFIVSGGMDGTVRIWDSTTGVSTGTFKAHEINIDCLALSPNGRVVATGSFDHTVKLWDIASNKWLRTLVGHTGGVAALAFSPDGQTLVTASHDHSVKLWNTDSGELIHTFSGHPVAVIGVAFSPDGKQIASGGGGYNGHGVVIVWDVASRKLQYEFQSNDEWVKTVVFSPDGKLLVCGTNTQGHALHRWNPISGQDLGTLSTKSNAVYALAFSPNRRMLAFADSENSIRVCDTTTAEWPQMAQWKGEVLPIAALALSGDNRYLASADRSSRIKLWDLAHSAEFRSLESESENGIDALAFSSRNDLLASASDKTVILWNSIKAKKVRALPVQPASVRCLAFSPDGRFLATGTGDNMVRIWDLETNQNVNTLEGHIDLIQALAYSPDGNILASASRDMKIRLWNTVTGALIRTLSGHANWVNTVSFSPTGEILASGSNDKTIKLWRVKTGDEIRTLSGHTGLVNSVIFFPGGTRLASGGSDRAIKVWDVESGRELRQLEGHNDIVTALVASTTGILISGSADTQIMFWKLADARKLASLTVLNNSEWAVVEPGGRFDASDGGMKLMHWVIGRASIELDQLKRRFWDPDLLAKLLGFSEEPLKEVTPLADVRLPPMIKSTPVDANTNIIVTLSDRGGGNGQVEVVVNDKLVKTASPIPVGASGTSTATVNLAHEFIPGRANSIRVMAWNAEHTIRTRQPGFQLAYTPSGLNPTAPPKLYAIVAGISVYAPPTEKLNFAARDAVAFAKALELGAGRLFGADKVDMHLLSTDTSAKRVVAPTKANFVAAFDQVRQAAHPDDIVVVYLSGHGLGMDEQGDLYCYLTKDAEMTSPDVLSDKDKRERWAITSADLAEWITGSNGVKATKKVIILDTCAAGSASARLTQARAASPGRVRKALKLMGERTGFHVLMGCARDKVSFESSRYGQGILTYALLEGVKGAALQGGEFVDVDTLFGYAQNEVQRLAFDIEGIQRPQRADPDGGSFPIGQLNDEDKAAIPLSRAKETVLKPTLLNETEKTDDLDLSVALGSALDDESATETGNQQGPPFIYTAANTMPGAIGLSGTYTKTGRSIRVDLRMYRDKQTIKKFVVTNNADDIPGLADAIVKEVRQAIIQLPPP